ncbi:MAG TPA: hypothetical protein VHA33_23685 [Candidatus Angelobacter sp.]|jgi:hypothetical protein|nr:hypothetical protein [Candidatus Angelobacter sp.]
MEMKDERSVCLCLTDEIKEVVDESGVMGPVDQPAITYRSNQLVRQIEDLLGTGEWNTKLHDRKKRFPFSSGHSFGGHEVLTSSNEILFMLAGTAIIKGAFSLLREWLDLKKSRKASIEVKGKNGEVVRIDITGHSLEQIDEVVLSHFKK